MNYVSVNIDQRQFHFLFEPDNEKGRGMYLLKS